MPRTARRKPYTKPETFTEAEARRTSKRQPDISNEELLDILLHQFNKLSPKTGNADPPLKDNMDAAFIPPTYAPKSLNVLSANSIWNLVRGLTMTGDNIDAQVRRLSSFARRYGAILSDQASPSPVTAQAPFTLREHLDLLADEYTRLYNQLDTVLSAIDEIEGEKAPPHQAGNLSVGSSR